MILFLTGQILLQLTVPRVSTIHGLPYNIVVPNKVTGLLQTHFYLHLVLNECEFWTLLTSLLSKWICFSGTELTQNCYSSSKPLAKQLINNKNLIKWNSHTTNTQTQNENSWKQGRGFCTTAPPWVRFSFRRKLKRSGNWKREDNPDSLFSADANEKLEGY